jgi:hypothetical protein
MITRPAVLFAASLIASFVPAANVLASTPGDIVTTTLCELLNTPKIYLNRMVRVRVQADGSWFEYARVYDTHCPHESVELGANAPGAHTDKLQTIYDAVTEANRRNTSRTHFVVDFTLVGIFSLSGAVSYKYELHPFDGILFGVVPGPELMPPPPPFLRKTGSSHAP